MKRHRPAAVLRRRPRPPATYFLDLGFYLRSSKVSGDVSKASNDGVSSLFFSSLSVILAAVGVVAFIAMEVRSSDRFQWGLLSRGSKASASSGCGGGAAWMFWKLGGLPASLESLSEAIIGVGVDAALFIPFLAKSSITNFFRLKKIALPTRFASIPRKKPSCPREYARSNPKPTAALVFGGTVLDVKPSPVVAAFSSRRPNIVTPQILKPDVIGPGVNILAAWSEAIGPTGLAKDTRKTMFNIMSGTSMSCPHISGLAALIKAAHPEWSPSAIKSALMTTAYTQDNTNSSLRDAANGSFSNPWAHGAGHVDPQKAPSPGLVYDIFTDEYITFLCSLGYTIDHVKTIVKRPNFTCWRKFNDPGELNYPSFSVLFRIQSNSQWTIDSWDLS
ncbi:hypothetical protein F3Y22_tig00111634pilonHSYRG00015 [Hibiscus syriacus]|uniref:Peptidase S8/S53 domain-containing protein n=1 Tax=Hibiscus syriacus TaxID=106335 RepID=A0A6A2XJN0_HIBSY|nr:hypothetical protein F3Y22_tig00111634pilonHSYRG00015 [Hibiscus syriacus]